MTEKSSPIHSMTGFGRADSVIQNVPLQVEIKSVNHRYCEVKVRMPKELSHLEPKIRREIQSHVNRGRVELFFRFATENQELPTQPDINMGLANQYIALYKQLAETAEQPDTKVDPAVIFQMPGVITQVSATEDIDSWSEPLLDTMRQALVPFLEMRKQEGQHLHQDIQSRLKAIVERLNTIESLTPELPQKQFEKHSGWEREKKCSIIFSLSQPECFSNCFCAYRSKGLIRSYYRSSDAP